MSYRGDVRLGDTLDVKFSTVGTTGAPTTLAGSPVISAYVDNSTTQITAGITLTVDFDGVAGLHNVRVVASAGNGFAAATNVDLVITTGTVGGTSVVGYVIGSFSIEDRSAFMRLGAPAGASVSADIAAAKADTAAIKTKTDFLPSAAAGAAGGVFIAGSNAATTAATFTITGAFSINGTSNVAQTGDNFARLGAPAGASVSADVAAVKTDTAAVKTKTDQLTFSGSMVEANMKKINGTTLVGNGASPKFGV